MDPNATLNIVLDRAKFILELGEEASHHPEVEEMAQAFTELHEWLSSGGGLPREWERAK